jgi:hypothetical protein
MTVQYIHLDYESYKSLESQMRAFKETSHKSEGGFYHKSIRLRVAADLIMEFHAPLVGGFGHNTPDYQDPENL